MSKIGFFLLWLACAGAWGQITPAPEGCPDMVAEIKRLFDAKDGALLKVDILNKTCRDEELYQAAYYQGFAFYFLGRYEEALADFELAHSIRGPWDEQILFYIWKIQGNLKDTQGQERSLEDFQSDYPGSRHLRQMENSHTQTISSKFGGMAILGVAYLHGDSSYQGPKSRSFLSGTYSQDKGNQRFSEYVNLSGNLALDGNGDQNVGCEGGLQYNYKDFMVQGEVGPLLLISRPNSVDSLDTSHVSRSWEMQQALYLSQSFHMRHNWSWSLSLNYYRSGTSFHQSGTSLETFDIGWGADKFFAKTYTSVQVRGETLNLKSLCGDTIANCEQSRILALETDWSHSRYLGRHIPGAEARLRLEVGQTANAIVRQTGMVGLQYGFQIKKGLKLSNRAETGMEWEGSTKRIMLNAATTLISYF